MPLPTAELVRMRGQDGPLGVAIILREGEQAVDVPLAEEYLRRMRMAIASLPPLAEEVRRGAMMTISHASAPGAIMRMPHKMTVEEGERLVVEIEKVLLEIKKRNKGTIYA
jgi:hypothetical protein